MDPLISQDPEHDHNLWKKCSHKHSHEVNVTKATNMHKVIILPSTLAQGIVDVTLKGLSHLV